MIEKLPHSDNEESKISIINEQIRERRKHRQTLYPEIYHQEKQLLTEKDQLQNTFQDETLEIAAIKLQNKINFLYPEINQLQAESKLLEIKQLYTQEKYSDALKLLMENTNLFTTPDAPLPPPLAKFHRFWWGQQPDALSLYHFDRINLLKKESEMNFENFSLEELQKLQETTEQTKNQYLKDFIFNANLYPDSPKKRIQIQLLLIKNLPDHHLRNPHQNKTFLAQEIHNNLKDIRNAEANRQAIIALETAQPDSTLYLHEKYGITNFYRYKKQQLLRQYHLTHQESPNLHGYVLCQTASSDYNEAIRDLHVTTETDSLGKDYATIITEMRQINDLIKHTHFVTQKFGAADIIVITGHGTHGTIKLGNLSSQTLNEEINLTNYTKIQADALKSNGQIVLQSCSTGSTQIIEDKASLAAHLSHALQEKNIKIFAPTHPAESTSFRLNLAPKNDLITADPDAARNLSSKKNHTATYLGGNLIDSDGKILKKYTSYIGDKPPDPPKEIHLDDETFNLLFGDLQN